jgi:hypothetical protein
VSRLIKCRQQLTAIASTRPPPLIWALNSQDLAILSSESASNVQLYFTKRADEPFGHQ